MHPLFHFTAPDGWINDPHGITFVDGTYHAFFQYVPASTTWRPECRWGHAAGPTLFELEPRPVALSPGDGDDGIWTGSLVRADDTARIFYTSVQKDDLAMGRIRTATPADPSWDSWVKGDILIIPPADLGVTAFRDPFVFRDGDEWRMLVGASLNGTDAAALAYSSADLSTWSFEGVAAQRPTDASEGAWTGSLWECPQLFSLGESHALVSSVWKDDVLYYAAYGLGDYRDGVFTASRWGQLSYGPSYYAPSFFRDASGTPCLLFWLRGVEDPSGRWTSAHSIPYRLGLDADGLTITPHPDLERYRSARVQPGEPADSVAAEILWSPSASSSLTIRSGVEELCVLSVGDGSLSITAAGRRVTMPHREGELHVVIDAGVVEASDGRSILASAIPAPADHLALVVAAAEGEATIYPLTR